MRPALLLPLLLLAPLAQGWVAGPDRPHHADLALLAAQRLPSEMRALIERHPDEFRRGALDPDGIVEEDKDVHVFYHQYEPADGSGGGVWRIQRTLVDAVAALREGDEAEAAYQLGFLTHFSTDLALPLHAGRGAFEHPRHEELEKEAYDHRHELRIDAPARAPRDVGDVEAYAIRLAEASAEMWRDLEPHADAWTPETAAVVSRAATLAVEATADLLYTAFAQADPARPPPAEPGLAPLPRETADLAWGPREVALATGALIVAGVAAALVVRRASAR